MALGSFLWIATDGSQISIYAQSPDYALLTGDTGLGPCPIEYWTDQGAFQDGQTCLGQHMTTRTVTIPIMISAPDPATLATKIAALESSLDATLGIGQLIFNRADGQSFVLNCGGLNSPTLDPSVCGPTWQKATLTFIAHDPYWYGNPPVIIYFSGTPAPMFPNGHFNLPWSPGIFGGTQTFNNPGKISMALITFVGPSTTPVITLLKGSNTYTIKLNITLAAGDTFAINTNATQLTAIYTPNGGSLVNGTPYIDANSYLSTLLIGAGANTITYSCTTAGTGSYCSVQYSPRYVGV